MKWMIPTFVSSRVSPLPSKKSMSESDEEDQCMYGRFYSTTLSGEGRQEGHGMFELSLSLIIIYYYLAFPLHGYDRSFFILFCQNVGFKLHTLHPQ